MERSSQYGLFTASLGSTILPHRALPRFPPHMPYGTRRSCTPARVTGPIPPFDRIMCGGGPFASAHALGYSPSGPVGCPGLRVCCGAYHASLPHRPVHTRARVRDPTSAGPPSCGPLHALPMLSRSAVSARKFRAFGPENFRAMSCYVSGVKSAPVGPLAPSTPTGGCAQCPPSGLT